LLRPHRVNADRDELGARRGGTTSLVLKAFLLTGTIGLIVWAGTLPDNAQQDPVGFDLLLVALIGAALTLLVLRLLRRTRPLLMPHLVWGVRRFRGEGPVLDVIAIVLVVLAILGYLLALVGLVVVAVMAAFGHQGVPEAVVVTPFCVGVGATVVLWAMGRAELPTGGGT
jgi:hypothetical protein